MVWKLNKKKKLCTMEDVCWENKEINQYICYWKIKSVFVVAGTFQSPKDFSSEKEVLKFIDKYKEMHK